MCGSENAQNAVGVGVAPDTYSGVALIDTDIFTIRFSDSEMQYECRRSELYDYRKNDPAAAIFRTIGRVLTNNTGINGANIYFENAAGFAEYRAATAFCFASLGNENVPPESLCGFFENAGSAVALLSEENTCIVKESGSIYRIGIPLDDRYVIIALIKCGKSKLSANGSFAKNEKANFDLAVKSLKKGAYADFFETVKQSSLEYLSTLEKCPPDLKTLFETAENTGVPCGMYGQKGIYAFVQKKDTDDFIKNLGKAFETKCGYRPDFYVGATSATKLE